ncbi:ABC transporter permease [Dactylosporangium sp. NPDC051484]|uniref:ABC transporter permease n=1 Tax=Dactylosporangium sp. NPDC051484 TaxID=3154942 RepID=UPI00344D17F9
MSRVAQAGLASQAHRWGRRILAAPATWSVAAAIAVWLITVARAGRGLENTLVSAAVVAVFLVLAGIGQMFVITAGNGNIDLSISYVMTLSGFAAVRVMDGSNSRLLWGVLAAIVVGLACGLLNFIVIRGLGVPPIVATLAVGFVLFSISQRLAHSGSSEPSPGLTSFTSVRWLGVPIGVAATLVVSLVAAIILHRTVFGRSVQSVGQNLRAARLSGISVDLTVAMAYVASGLFAGLAGLMLAGYSGGAALDLANTYQIASIAVVVLGGSLIAGGRSTVVGVWGAAMFLTLLTTMLNVLGLIAAWQLIVQGVLMVAVLALAAGNQRRSR